jgi:hypothetical protein
MMTVLWKEKRGIHRLPNIHSQPAEGNFGDEKGNTRRPHVVGDHNHPMGDVDMGCRMANQVLHIEMDEETVPPLDLTILNSCVLLTSCGGKKISHRVFPLPLVRSVC